MPGRLSHTSQPAPMPRGGYEGTPHPELIRMLDGHPEYRTGDEDHDRNIAAPFGDNLADEPNEADTY